MTIELTVEEELLIQRNRKSAEHQEYNYLNLLQDIMENGKLRGDRTGTGTKSIFGTQMKFDLSKTIPLLTTKRVYWRGVVEELLWFIRGDTNSNNLVDKKVKIWEGNTTREFLDNRGLGYPEGFIGPGYGWQWRNFNGTYSNKLHDMPSDFAKDAPPFLYELDKKYGTAYGHNDGVDQLANVIETIRTNPNDRRMIVSAWNPQQTDKMALPPCHILFQFFVENGRLNCQMYQRSCDFFLGSSFNIASYALLTMLIAKITNLEAGELTMVGGDTHIYTNHFDQVQLQLQREPFPFPTIDIPDVKTLEDIENLTFDDLKLNNYECHAVIKADMAV